jgi:hypothetical protein
MGLRGGGGRTADKSWDKTNSLRRPKVLDNILPKNKERPSLVVECHAVGQKKCKSI